jgi:predicted methyltransferase
VAIYFLRAGRLYFIFRVYISTTMIKVALLFAATAVFAAISPALLAQSVALPPGLQAAVDGPHRDPANRLRDAYRHPLQTLAFFGIRDDMTVIEISPGAGWYSEILGPLLHDKGRLILAGGVTAGLRARVTDKAGVLGRASLVDFLPPRGDPAQTPQGVDMVLTFRNVHNWITAGTVDAVFAGMFRSLKSGGVLGVVEHRANPALPVDARAANGYVHESQVIAFAEAAGFRLAARSENNANALDTKDYAAGVWALPPTLRAGNSDRDKYLAIGESDRMTLRFVKP